MRNLTIEEIERAAAAFKEDLTGECERRVRRGDSVGALNAIHAKEHIDRFVRDLKLRAGSQLQEYLSKPARARPIHINSKILKAK